MNLAELIWRPKSTIPTDGTRIDVCCCHPDNPNLQVRFTDVQMRGDKSGFGIVINNTDEVNWEYIERDGPLYPKWIITHWMHIPDLPTYDQNDPSIANIFGVSKN